MKIGLAQMDISWENPTENYIKCSDFCDMAKSENVDVLIFPETVCNGFTNNIDSIVESSKHFYENMRKLSIKHDFVIVFGMISPGISKDKGMNQCIAFKSSGELIWRYTKIHPFSFANEDTYFDRGSEIVAANIYGNRCSPFICYDLRFPEIFQAASVDSEILIVIANWPAARIEHWDILLRARAIENQAFVIGVNRVGNGNNIDYCGHSAVYSPYGNILNPLSGDEKLIIVDIKPGESSEYRNSFRVKQDRNHELYAQLYLKAK